MCEFIVTNVQHTAVQCMSLPLNLNFSFRFVDMAVITHLFGDSISIHV